LLVTGCIDNHVIPLRRFERNLCRVDGDVLLLFFEQGIKKKGKLELHVFRGAGALHLFKFSFRQRISVAQDATDEGGLAMVDVTNEDDAQGRLATGCWMLDALGALLGACISLCYFLYFGACGVG